jgi:polyphosphate kinase
MKNHIPKEVSWLSFNARVLEEAEDPSVPLLERIKFLGIYSNNFDEFFRVRVAALNRLIELGSKKAKDLIGHNPKKVLKEVQSLSLNLQSRFDRAYAGLLKELAGKNIHIIDESQLTEAQGECIRAYFKQVVRPLLFPVMIDQVQEFPQLKDQTTYLLVALSRKDGSLPGTSALIEVPPPALPRFFILPHLRGSGDKPIRRHIILLDDIIRFGLPDIFQTFDFDSFSAYTIKVTRDAELEIDDDLSQSYLQKMVKSLKQRREGAAVRLVYDANLPVPLFTQLCSKLHLDENDTRVPGGRYHNFKDFIGFPDLWPKKHHYKPLPPEDHSHLDPKRSLFDQISRRDVLLHYPYQSFSPVIDLLREASIDPKVSSIKITLYRVAKNSAVVNALINAVKNGKKVTAIMELQARFDEEANITWSNRLEEAGARVIHGVPGLKVHAKLCLVNRKEGLKLTRYAIMGTGNFNEDTARIYSDHSLFTTNPKLTGEAARMFDFFDNNYSITSFKHLVVAPFQMRKKINRLIKAEINNAREGGDAWIHLKLNNLVDPKIINKLYEASRAGVKIRLNVRGMFSLVPGVPGLSENIEAISIVDRFLEHTRIFVFANDGKPLVYLTSGDLMRRNLDRRVELTVPIFDSDLKEELLRFLDIQWADTVKARVRRPEIKQKRRSEIRPRTQAQPAIYAYLKSLHKKDSEED